MAIIGSVVSTALTGGDSPIYERAIVASPVIEQALSESDIKLAAALKRIDALTELVEKLVPVEAPAELTPAEKAAATRAANAAVKAAEEAAKAAKGAE